ncbi:MAG: hypothetical protein IKS30_04455 [Treponema sp.]|nr:hypothetical protein [Treponema sp.]HAC31788.1 hypothetical protein [Treponema sp.]
MEQFSPAAQVIIALIPIIGIVFAAVLIFFALLWRHHEIKMQISKGTYEVKRFNFRLFALFSGLSLTGVGVMLTIMFFMMNSISWGLLGGLIPLVLGIMNIIFYKMLPNEK